MADATNGTNYLATCGAETLNVVVPEGQDLDGTVHAFCLDEQEWLVIDGWQCDWEVQS